jgi:hypothetical protein
MLAVVPDQSHPDVPGDIVDLAEQRATARAARDWQTADRHRQRIEAAGWRVIDDGVRFTLWPARPADVTEQGVTFYGAPESVPSRFDEPDSTAESLLLVIGPEARDRVPEAIAGLESIADAQVIVVASRAVVAAGLPRLAAVRNTELVGTTSQFSPGDALTAALRRAVGARIIVLDPTQFQWIGMTARLLAALDDPSVSIVGATGLCSTDLRRFGPAGPGDVTAIDSGSYAFRRMEAVARGPLDGRLHLSVSVAIWWSLALRDEGPDRAPRRAIALEAPQRAAGSDLDLPAEQTRLARRDGYRIAGRFAPCTWLGRACEEVARVPGDRAHGHEQDDDADEERQAGDA